MRYTNEFLISELKRFYKENGRTPRKRDITPKNGYPSFGTYANYFGSWNNALIEAGLEINEIREPTKEFLISELQRFKRENGRVPRIKDMSRKNGYPSRVIYQRLFGTFNNALIEAGLETCTNGSNTIKGKKAEEQIIYTLKNAKRISEKNWHSEYDILCNKGYKVEVKSSKLHINGYSPFWYFKLKQNDICDYYFCIGYDSNFEEIEHVWKFKNDTEFKNRKSISVSMSKLYKLSSYEIDLDICLTEKQKMLKEKKKQEAEEKHEVFKKAYFEKLGIEE